VTAELDRHQLAGRPLPKQLRINVCVTAPLPQLLLLLEL
jgi:hypothetical protein